MWGFNFYVLRSNTLDFWNNLGDSAPFLWVHLSILLSDISWRKLQSYWWIWSWFPHNVVGTSIRSYWIYLSLSLGLWSSECLSGNVYVGSWSSISSPFSRGFSKVLETTALLGWVISLVVFSLPYVFIVFWWRRYWWYILTSLLWNLFLYPYFLLLYAPDSLHVEIGRASCRLSWR